MNVRTKWMFANWKVSGSKELMHAALRSISGLLNQTNAGSLVIATPNIYIRETIALTRELSPYLAVGCKNINTELHTFTGDLSAQQAKQLGVDVCVIGHKERNAHLNEGHYSYRLKINHLIHNGINPVLCIGETQAERESGLSTERWREQILSALQDVALQDLSKITLVYEPCVHPQLLSLSVAVFAEQTHSQIRALIGQHYGVDIANKIRIIYGGPVNIDNLLSVINQPNVDGLFMDCANSNLGNFNAICQQFFGFKSVYQYKTEVREEKLARVSY